MNTDDLQQTLDILIESLSTDDRSLLKARLAALLSAYPFNEFEYSLMFLLDKRSITFDVYENLRESYVSANKHLSLFELAPRVFGEIWGHEHLIDLDRRFSKASKSLDPSYDGQYDLWIEGVKVEVKAARAINTKKRSSLVSKALRFGTREPFWMNYQQLKTQYCDVFIFIGVWVDQIRYWVMSSQEVERNENLSRQHRGGIEFQIGITNRTIEAFDKYLVDAKLIGDAVIRKA